MSLEAIRRLQASIEGKPRGTKGRWHLGKAPALCEVLPEDVIAACEMVPHAKRSEVVRDLHYGSSNAPKGDGKTVLIQVDCCCELLDAVAAMEQPGPGLEPNPLPMV